VVGAAEVDWCRRDGAGLEIVSVGSGTHFLPEDQPEAISRALGAWLGGRGESHIHKEDHGSLGPYTAANDP
jgi:hypothetical protein